MPPEQVECVPTDKRPSAALTAWGMAQETEPPMQDVPYGFCHCGCGERTNLAPYSNAPDGWVRGEPLKYIAGHQNRGKVRWREEDRGHTTPCWLWLGFVDGRGYGRKSFRRGFYKFAHRWVYEQQVGIIPPGLTLDHLCRVRHCVNPDHMEPVTNVENVMRGEGFSAKNARKTHCPQGHPYAGDNLVIGHGGSRRCRTCQNKRMRDAYWQRKGKT